MIRINTEIIKKLKPCEDSFQIWLDKYPDWEGSIVEALELEGIPAEDKVWVAVRLLPRDIVEIFAIDCAFSASASAAYYYASAYASASAASAAYAAHAHASAHAYASASASAAYYYASAHAYASAYASASASASAAYAARKQEQEQENQVDALIMLCEDML